MRNEPVTELGDHKQGDGHGETGHAKTANIAVHPP